MNKNFGWFGTDTAFKAGFRLLVLNASALIATRLWIG